MPAAIGLRVYRAFVLRRNSKDREPVPSVELKLGREDFLSGFIAQHAGSTSDTARERSWYFEEREPSAPANSKGYIHYGTYGFESRFLDPVTREEKFARRTADVEEIPLFYEMWSPPTVNATFLAFQSFQGRSCVTLVLHAMQKSFEQINDGYVLRFSKLMPGNAGASVYKDAPVKKLTLIKRRAGGDSMSRYRGSVPRQGVDFEYAFRARRNGDLGPFGDLTDTIEKNADGVILYDGMEFDAAVAEVLIGNRRRPVGVFGSNGDTGAIDISSDIEFSGNGHPTYASLASASDEIITDFYTRLYGDA